MKLECVLLACVACVSAVAAPVISNVAWSQDPATRRVTVTYALNERAIVTMDDVIESLWKSDGSGAISNEIKKELDDYYAQWGAAR